MTTPPDLLPPTTRRPRAGAHRARGSWVSAVMPSLLAVAAVAALITSLAVWQSEEQARTQLAERGQHGAATAEPSASSAQALASEPTQTPTPTASVSAAPTPSASPSSTKKVDVAGTKAARPDIEVVVLNQTSRPGLAATVAQRLQTSGWAVPHVGNFRGIVPSTTVYYPVGAETEAMAVAKDLPTAPRIRPRFGNLSTSRLTVVVTDSYPG